MSVLSYWQAQLFSYFVRLQKPSYISINCMTLHHRHDAAFDYIEIINSINICFFFFFAQYNVSEIVLWLTYDVHMTSKVK